MFNMDESKSKKKNNNLLLIFKKYRIRDCYFRNKFLYVWNRDFIIF